jgi:2-keto-4-pentenoate hydratase/2-oxohepta-3-ene-1,7-dioic acid hydratase in catechol pathway
MTMQMRLRDGVRELVIEPTKIVCLLRNYAEHAKELKNTVPTQPRFFLKPPSSLLPEGGTILIPPTSNEVHHEVELALVIGKEGRAIPLEKAMDHVLGYLVMLDITARDIQDAAKAKGLPWAEAKGYDTFAPYCRSFVRREDHDWRGKRIFLSINGEIKQDGNTSDMIFPVDRIVSAVSEVMTLERHDLILTGTPAGVGPMRKGDTLRAGIEGIGEGTFHVDQM